MANPEHVGILKQGVEVWSRWRKKNTEILPDLSEANLSEADLREADLRVASLGLANLCVANLRGADLRGADFSGANLRGANLRDADLREANLGVASLRGADLRGANFSGADLRLANFRLTNLCGADLSTVDFNGTDLRGADFKNARCWDTIFANVDLSETKNLDNIDHQGPSTIGIDTLYKSKGNIPEVFLRGCGVPDQMIEYAKSLTGSPIEYYSCFISYSHKDEEFAKRIHNDLQAAGVRCWFAPHDIQAGKKIHHQIDEAIRFYDKLLLILSPDSINSNWVGNEIIRAKKKEDRQDSQMLFPVSIVPFQKIKDWEFFDSDSGRDLAREIREYFIPDFSLWKSDHDAYSEAFERLLRDLKA